LIEAKKPAAIITATGRNPDLVGALYPYPLIEDGDFDIPSVYCRDTVGEKIAASEGIVCRLKSNARRIPATAWNVVAQKKSDSPCKIVICAHIDAKATTPGALDNAAGTVVLLLLAEILDEYDGPLGIEIIAINGEDNFTAGGEMDYLRRYGQGIGATVVAINIDGVGYIEGKTAYSFYGCPQELRCKVSKTFDRFNGIFEGPAWPQGDHMVFMQKGVPAVALTSDKVVELMRKFTHTSGDTPSIVDCGRLVEVAEAIGSLIREFGG
jgi:aminopeptidase YwaD